MAEKVVTFEGATPAGGGSQVRELVVEDDDEHRAVLTIGVPETVSDKLAKAAQGVEHHKVKVETVADHEKAAQAPQEEPA